MSNRIIFLVLLLLTLCFGYLGMASQVSADSTLVYTVQAGDTISSISSHFGIPTSTLTDKNRIIHADNLYAGQQLFIPLTDIQAENAPKQVTNQVHIVQSGETLTNLAVRYDSSVAELIQVNQLASPDILHIGQQLVIPVEVAVSNDIALQTNGAATNMMAAATVDSAESTLSLKQVASGVAILTIIAAFFGLNIYLSTPLDAEEMPPKSDAYEFVVGYLMLTWQRINTTVKQRRFAIR